MRVFIEELGVYAWTDGNQVMKSYTNDGTGERVDLRDADYQNIIFYLIQHDMRKSLKSFVGDKCESSKLV